MASSRRLAASGRGPWGWPCAPPSGQVRCAGRFSGASSRDRKSRGAQGQPHAAVAAAQHGAPTARAHHAEEADASSASPAQPAKAVSRLRQMWTQYGYPGMIFYSCLYVGMGGAIFAYLELSPDAVPVVTNVIDSGAQFVGIDWRQYVDEGAVNTTFAHAVLAAACNEVLEVVRLPVALVAIPILFRKRGG